MLCAKVSSMATRPYMADKTLVQKNRDTTNAIYLSIPQRTLSKQSNTKTPFMAGR